MTEDAQDAGGENPLGKLAGLVCEDIRSRQRWTDRQNTWYQMRHDGLRRRNKPWPHAADLHYPLADSMIDKLKPFYFNQMFGTATIAEFVARQAPLMSLAADTAAWFDCKIKQRSNLEYEILVAIDMMLMCGHDPVMVYWDADEGRLAFDAIEPQHCIVPEDTAQLSKADRVTIVHHLSAEAYKRDSRFTRKEKDFIQRISGRGSGETGDSEYLRQAKEIREGITHSATGVIIVWEIWEHRGEGWWVHWISPMALDEPLRPSQANPFKHGRLPIVRFDCEIKEKGHLSSRGIPERVAGAEASLNRHWNSKNDTMELYNRPIFTSSGPIPNASNLQLLPGQIIPGPITAVQMPPPPLSFDQEMLNNRSMAEYNVSMPDYGLTGASQGGGDQSGGTRTAREISAIGGLMGANVDLRSRVFRMSLAMLLQLAWETLVQYDRETAYFLAGEAKELPDAALQAQAWAILPAGDSSSWDRQAQQQKAILRKQLFAQSPWINQPELDKSILELDDPRLVGRLFIDPQQRQKDAYSDEATKIPTLLLGLPLPASPTEDQEPVRIKCLMDFMDAAPAHGHEATPGAMGAIKARISSLLQQLGGKNPNQARQLGAMIDQISSAHAKAARLAPGAQAVAPPGGAAGPGVAPAAQSNGEAKPPFNISVAFKDLAPSERAQVLAADGIHAATQQEVLAHRAAMATLDAGAKAAHNPPTTGGES